MHDRRSLRRFGVLTLVVLIVLVVRSPAEVLSIIGPSRSAGATLDADAIVPEGVEAATDHDGPPARTPAGSPAGAPGGDAPAEGRWGTPAERPTTSMLLEELRGTWRVESGAEESVALAVIAAHRWADEQGLAGRTAGGGGAIVTVEAVERPGATYGVVTLLVASDDALHRVAVPVHLGPDRIALAGRPWPLPAPTLRTVGMERSPIGDSELLAAARRAVEHIGVAGDRLVGLDATDGWPFIARLDGDGDDLWLRWHVDRFVVAGLPLQMAEER